MLSPIVQRKRERMTERGTEGNREKAEENRQTAGDADAVLSGRNGNSGIWNYDEYENGTRSISNHIDCVQCVHDLEAELWKYDNGIILCVCDRTVYHTGQRQEMAGSAPNPGCSAGQSTVKSVQLADAGFSF